MSGKPARLIVGMSGASGAVLGIRLLQRLREQPVETHLVMSRAAEITVAYETNEKIAAIRALADHWYKPDDIAAAVSSGSFETIGMVVVPCSIRSASEIASGITSSLLTRAADVVLKERRRLVLMVRETPLHLGHLRTLAALTEIGAIVAPPMLALNTNPQNLDQMIDQILEPVLNLFGLDDQTTRRRTGQA
jgi:4-hydroxy-3-polyprenylbenzoate decarboxylase